MFTLTGWLCLFCINAAAETRKPAVAGSFYPSGKQELEELIGRLTEQAKQTRVELPAGKSLKALILPHAGYIYSGLTAAHASLVLSEGQFQKVILMGPDHRIGFANAAISQVDAYETPLGAVHFHRDVETLRKDTALFSSIPGSGDSEHSLEVELPFLQYCLKRFELIPIIMGSGDIERYFSAISPLVDSQTLIVASSDLSHYLPYQKALDTDRETLRMILSLSTDSLAKKDNAACGKFPILVLLKMAKQYDWQPLLLNYTNSGDTAGRKDRVVGYAAIAFYGGSSMKQISKEQGKVLLNLARQTISSKLGQKVTLSDSLADALKDNDFKAHCGTFVTLKIDGQLRGCIGNLSSSETIVEGVKRNAENAAFHDYRFSPLKAKELANVEIEVSVLTEPKPLEFKDGDDLLSKLRVNVDGVIIRRGSASATFLPQVWEQLPKPDEFLSHLCSKAGLPANSWKKPGLEVLTYQVQYFEEE